MLAHLDSIICTRCHLSVHLGPGFNSFPTCSAYLGMSPMCHLSERQCWIQPVGKAGRRLRKQTSSPWADSNGYFKLQLGSLLYDGLLPSAHWQVGRLLIGISGCYPVTSCLPYFRRPLLLLNHWNLNVTSNAHCIISPSSFLKKIEELSIICA